MPLSAYSTMFKNNVKDSVYATMVPYLNGITSHVVWPKELSLTLFLSLINDIAYVTSILVWKYVDNINLLESKVAAAIDNAGEAE